MISIDNLICSAVLGGADVLETAEEAEIRSELQDDIEQKPEDGGNPTEGGETVSKHCIWFNSSNQRFNEKYGLFTLDFESSQYLSYHSLTDTADISLKIILLFIYYQYSDVRILIAIPQTAALAGQKK